MHAAPTGNLPTNHTSIASDVTAGQSPSLAACLALVATYESTSPTPSCARLSHHWHATCLSSSMSVSPLSAADSAAVTRRQAVVSRLVQASLLRADAAADPRESRAAKRENYKLNAAAAERAYRRARFHHAPLGAEVLEQLANKDTSFRQPFAAHLERFTDDEIAGRLAACQTTKWSGLEQGRTADLETAEESVAGMRVEPPPDLGRIRGGLLRHLGSNRRDKNGGLPVEWAQPGDGALIARKLQAAGYNPSPTSEASSALAVPSSDEHVAAVPRHPRGVSNKLPASVQSRARALPSQSSPLDAADSHLVSAGAANFSLGAIKRAFVYPYNLSQHLPSNAGLTALTNASSTATGLRKLWTLPLTSKSNVPVSAKPLRGRDINPLQFDSPLDAVSRTKLRTRQSQPPGEPASPQQATTASTSDPQPAVSSAFPVPGGRGDRVGFGSSVGGAARLVLARKAAAVDEVLNSMPVFTPVIAAVTQSTLVDALPLFLVFHSAAENSRGKGPTSIAEQSEPLAEHHLSVGRLNSPTASGTRTQATTNASISSQENTSASTTQDCVVISSWSSRQRELLRLRSKAALPPQARAPTAAAPCVAVLQQARKDLVAEAPLRAKIQARRHAQGLPPQQGEGKMTMDQGVARAAIMRLAARRGSEPPARKTENASTLHKTDVNRSLFLKLSKGPELVNPEMASAVELMRSGGFRRVLGLAVHFAFWRILRRMAGQLFKDENPGASWPSPLFGSSEQELSLLRLLIRSWCVLDSMANQVGASAASRSMLLLALKAGVEAQLRCLYPKWASFDRSVGFFHERFGGDAAAAEFAARIPILIPLHAQVDALLSACFDTARMTSTIPRLAVSHEALSSLRRARATPAVRGLGILPTMTSTGSSALSSSSARSTLGVEVLSVVCGLPYLSHMSTTKHMTSSLVHAALPSAQDTAQARSIITPGGMASQAPLNVATACSTATGSSSNGTDDEPAHLGPRHATEAELLHMAVLRRICVAYTTSSSRQVDHAGRLEQMVEMLLDSSVAYRNALRASLFQQTALLMAIRSRFDGDNANPLEVSGAVEAAANGALFDHGNSLSLSAGTQLAQAAIIETTDMLEVGCWRTANDVIRRARSAPGPLQASTSTPRRHGSAGGSGNSSGLQHQGERGGSPIGNSYGHPVLSPLRACEGLIGRSWAEEQEADVAQLFEQVDAWTVMHPDSRFADKTTIKRQRRPASRSKPSHARGKGNLRTSVAAESAVLALARSGSRALLLHALQSTPTAGHQTSHSAPLAPARQRPKGLRLPLDAVGITELIAARNPLRPSPFSAAGADAHAPARWLRGPGARARAAELEEAKAAARAAAVRVSVRRSARLSEAKAEVHAARELATRAPRATDSSIVKYIRQVAKERVDRGLPSGLPDLAPLKAMTLRPVSLVGDPDSWELGLGNAGELS